MAKIRWAARVLMHDLFGEDDLKESKAILPGGPPGAEILGPIQG